MTFLQIIRVDATHFYHVFGQVGNFWNPFTSFHQCFGYVPALGEEKRLLVVAIEVVEMLHGVALDAVGAG